MSLFTKKTYLVLNTNYGRNKEQRNSYVTDLINRLSTEGMDLASVLSGEGMLGTGAEAPQEGPQSIFEDVTNRPNIVEQTASGITNRPRIIGEDTTVAQGVVGGRVVGITPEMIEREIVNTFNSRFEDINFVSEGSAARGDNSDSSEQDNFEDVPGGRA